MRTLATALRRHNPSIRLCLFAPGRRSQLAELELWSVRALGPEQATEHAARLQRELKASTGQPVAVFLENVLEFANGSADTALTELVRVCVNEGAFVAAEGEASTLATNMGLVGAVKQSRYGLALAPDPADGDRLFRTPFPHRLPRSEFPPGRALFVHAGHTPPVGVAWVEEGG
jgi:S-DNA-T family DNA segregation ATPase FtsK/SpoIIIE